MSKNETLNIDRRRVLGAGAVGAAAWAAPGISGRIVAGAATSDPPAPVPRDCVVRGDAVGWWRAENDFLDSSGNANHGAPQGDVSFGPGFDSTAAFSFTGAGDSEVVVPDSPSLSLPGANDAVTMAAWVYPTGNGTGGPQGGIIVNKEGEYEIARFGDGSLRVAVPNTTPGWIWVDTGVTIPLNTWSHVAVSYSDADARFRVWLDGTEAPNLPGDGPLGDAHPGSDTLRIGGRELFNQNFQGRIDEVQVFAYAVDDADLADVRNCFA